MRFISGSNIMKLQWATPKFTSLQQHRLGKGSKGEV